MGIDHRSRRGPRSSTVTQERGVELAPCSIEPAVYANCRRRPALEDQDRPIRRGASSSGVSHDVLAETIQGISLTICGRLFRTLRCFHRCRMLAQRCWIGRDPYKEHKTGNGGRSKGRNENCTHVVTAHALPRPCDAELGLGRLCSISVGSCLLLRAILLPRSRVGQPLSNRVLSASARSEQTDREPKRQQRGSACCDEQP
jgi:hypothetical protein